MNKLILTISLVLVCSLHSYSQTAQTQTQTSASAATAASAESSGKTLNLASGTRLSGALQQTIDVRKAKVGDEVVLKTTRAIKSEGRTVVKKGARLIGRVTEVSEKSEANGESRVGIVFDRLESGPMEVTIAARITGVSSIESRNNQAAAGIDSSSSASVASRPAAGQGSSPGVVGGVTNSVGGVVNTTTNVLGNTTAAVGSTVNSTVNAAGSTTSSVGNSLAGIRITESADASASSGSVLSLHGKNLRLEKGTTLLLELTQSASAGTGP